MRDDKDPQSKISDDAKLKKELSGLPNLPFNMSGLSANNNSNPIIQSGQGNSGSEQIKHFGGAVSSMISPHILNSSVSSGIFDLP